MVNFLTKMISLTHLMAAALNQNKPQLRPPQLVVLVSIQSLQLPMMEKLYSQNPNLLVRNHIVLSRQFLPTGRVMIILKEEILDPNQFHLTENEPISKNMFLTRINTKATSTRVHVISLKK